MDEKIIETYLLKITDSGEITVADVTNRDLVSDLKITITCLDIKMLNDIQKEFTDNVAYTTMMKISKSNKLLDWCTWQKY